MEEGLSPDDYEDFACTEVGSTIVSGLYHYKRIK